MTKWEYRTEGWPAKAWSTLNHVRCINELLAEMGEQGWELVNIAPELIAIFKRPAKPEPPALLVVNNVNGMEVQQLIDSIKDELGRYWEEKRGP